jgi:hypothetical protein
MSSGHRAALTSVAAVSVGAVDQNPAHTSSAHLSERDRSSAPMIPRIRPGGKRKNQSTAFFDTKQIAAQLRQTREIPRNGKAAGALLFQCPSGRPLGQEDFQPNRGVFGVHRERS